MKEIRLTRDSDFPARRRALVRLIRPNRLGGFDGYNLIDVCCLLLKALMESTLWRSKSSKESVTDPKYHEQVVEQTNPPWNRPGVIRNLHSAAKHNDRQNLVVLIVKFK